MFNACEARDHRLDVMFCQARREEIKRHNEEVRQNSEMLKTITNAVLYILGKQGMPVRGHDESSDSFNKGNYRELLECFAELDSVFERCLHGRLADSEGGRDSRFTGVSSNTQNELINRLDAFIENQIEDCFQRNEYVKSKPVHRVTAIVLALVKPFPSIIKSFSMFVEQGGWQELKGSQSFARFTWLF